MQVDSCLHVVGKGCLNIHSIEDETFFIRPVPFTILPLKVYFPPDEWFPC